MRLTSCGVIVEYNPFHNGHIYHLKEARKKSEVDVLVAVMSGNFLQRGEPAIIDKWQRAETALHNGADLVIELPFAYAVQSADYFAKGGIKLLHSLNVESLCFGTDLTQSMDYELFGQTYVEKEKLINQRYQEIKNNGESYPQQMTQIYRELLQQVPLDFSSPNHILGMAYAKENARYANPMSLIPITRQGSGYHDETIKSQEFSSATAIRQRVLEKDITSISHTVPSETRDFLENTDLHSWGDYWPLLKYHLLNHSFDELSDTYQLSEGIEYRLKESVKKAASFSGFMSLVKTKRYTWTRLQRLATYLLLNVREKEIHDVWQNSYLRVLGFTENGRQFLNQEKNHATLPIVTKIDQKNEKQLSLDIRAGQIYQLAQQHHHIEQDYYRSPIYLKGETSYESCTSYP